MPIDDYFQQSGQPSIRRRRWRHNVSLWDVLKNSIDTIKNMSCKPCMSKCDSSCNDAFSSLSMCVIDARNAPAMLAPACRLAFGGAGTAWGELTSVINGVVVFIADNYLLCNIDVIAGQTHCTNNQCTSHAELWNDVCPEHVVTDNDEFICDVNNVCYEVRAPNNTFQCFGQHLPGSWHAMNSRIEVTHIFPVCKCSCYCRNESDDEVSVTSCANGRRIGAVPSTLLNLAVELCSNAALTLGNDTLETVLQGNTIILYAK